MSPHSSSSLTMFCITQPHPRRWLIRGWWCMVAMMATSGWPTCTFSTLSSLSKLAAAHSFLSFSKLLTDPKPKISKKSLESAGWKRQRNHIVDMKSMKTHHDGMWWNELQKQWYTEFVNCQTCREFHPQKLVDLVVHRNTSEYSYSEEAQHSVLWISLKLFEHL